MIRLAVPGSKSITNRALIMASLAKGKTVLANALSSDDTKYMQQTLQNCGVKIKKNRDRVSVVGGALGPPKKKLFCGNAGTAVRFLTALLATQPFPSIITGNVRMQSRPIQDLLDALTQLGAEAVSVRGNGAPPIKVQGPLRGGSCTLSGSTSSQFLSGLLLAAPLAQHHVTIHIKGDLVSKPYVDMTIALMARFGVPVHRNGYKKFSIPSGNAYKATRYAIEGDASSASYFWGIGALTGEEIKITNIPKNSKQADMEFLNAIEKLKKFSPLHRRRSDNLVTFHCKNFPDAAMTLAILCAFHKGRFRLTGLTTLRVKECDRLAALKTELSKIGARVKEESEGLLIFGNPENLHAASIETYDDHRMAMCFGMASVFLPGIKIKNPGCVSKTYPLFWKDLAKVKKELRAKNIILTGMRGSGKTALGKLLAKKLKRQFIDCDEEIMKQAKMTIPHIVERFGWRGFRKREQQMVKKISSVKYAIIATGGGTLVRKANEEMLKQNGKILLLNCPLSILEKRLMGKTDRPPLMKKKNFLHELAGIYTKRKKRYSEVADGVLDASSNDLYKKTKKILATIRSFGIT